MVAALWEVYEFTIDSFGLATDPMQKGLADTMWDINVALIGGLIVCVFGYRFVRHREQNFVKDVADEYQSTQNDINEQMSDTQ